MLKFSIKNTLSEISNDSAVKKIIKKAEIDYAEIVYDETMQNLENSRSIHGNKMAPIKESTREVRRLRGQTGTKPLIASGAMKNSLRLDVSGKTPVMTVETYGNTTFPNAHQVGYMTKNNPSIKGKLFRFAGKSIPARPWLHNEYTVIASQRIQQQFKEVYREYFNLINEIITKKAKK